MPDIHELDPATVDRIAAGEVVERPASAVKELVENGVDAEATRVSVAVEAGGTDRIAVSDDGVGMTRAEVRQAVREHTTSKISDVSDLEAGVGTLGFRGEALHAIGAVSKVTIRTRPRDGGAGTELRLEGGEVVSVSPTGCPEGTSVEVTDLFYNVPARRKYLKQASTEFAHVNRVVTGYALADPDVAVSLAHDGRETFATPGDGDLRAAVMAVYGRDVAAAMVPVGADREGDDPDLPDGPLDGVRGLVSHPETNRAGSEYLNTFVNGRLVRAGAVREAVVDAYGRQLAADRYPFAALFLDVPAATVDVNVHPRKREVRFADEDGVREQVRAAVEAALLDEGLVRTRAPRGRSAPDQTEVAPERGSGPDAGDGDGDGSSAGPVDDAETADADRAAAGDAGSTGAAASPGSSRTSERSDSSGVGAPAAEKTATGAAGSTDPGDASGVAGDDPPGLDRGDGDRGRHRHAGGGEQRTLDGEPLDREHEFDRLPAMRVLGQYRDTYLVAETDDGLVLVDQHAADERVNYERLRERFAGDVTTQALAEPVDVSVTPAEAELFREYGDSLARLGFRASLVDDRTVRVSTVPALVAETAGPDLVRDLLADFVDGDPEGTVEAVVDDLLGDLACYPAVTGNESLREGTVVDLLRALDGCENPYACPHGRPVLVAFPAPEIEDRFERDYPGHGHRRD